MFYVSGDAQGIYLSELDGSRKTRLFDANGPAVYIEPGYLVFARGQQLLAQRFDYRRGTTSGDVLVLGEAGPQTWLSAARDGTLAYRTSRDETGQRHLLWLDRSGRGIERVAYPSFAAQGPALSHDGGQIALFRLLNNNMDVWSYNRQRQVWDRLTFDPGDDIYPLWSPDGHRIGHLVIHTQAQIAAATTQSVRYPEALVVLVWASSVGTYGSKSSSEAPASRNGGWGRASHRSLGSGPRGRWSAVLSSFLH
jgi:hypothetical protein